MIFATKNIDEVSRVLNHPKVYSWVSDDFSSKPYVPPVNENIVYLMDETKRGVVVIHPMNSIACYIHIALTPEMWGNGVKFAKDCILWGVENTRYMKAVVMIPIFNRLTIRLVKKCGFKKEGLLKKSFLKDWKLYDQEVYGITKAQVLANKGG